MLNVARLLNLFVVPKGLSRNITTVDLKQLCIALLTLDEQKQLATEASKVADGFDDFSAHANEEIGLIKELRTATIADVVSGRIDVRTSPHQSNNEKFERDTLGSHPERKAV